MKDNKTEEIINSLFKSNIDSLKDESLDINLSACATIPLATENDCSLPPPEFWTTATTDSYHFFPEQADLSNDLNSNKNNKRQPTQPKKSTSIFSNNQINDDTTNIDSVEIALKCDYCCEFFNDMETLKAHELNHKNTTFKCNNCDIVFLNENSLNTHSMIHQNQIDKETNPQNTLSLTSTDIIKCPDCGKMLKGRSMWMHRKIHSDKKQFCCDHCGQKFVQKINFINHMRIHTGENSHICNQCKKTFFNLSHLLRHQKYHSVVRSFKCEKCEKLYKTERCLKVHSLVHLDQRPFVCKVCNKSFISSSKLKQHLNIHTGERPYKCNYCSRDFTNFPNWLKHTRRRHKVDHKTGELLPIPPKQKQEKVKSSKQNNKNSKVLGHSFESTRNNSNIKSEIKEFSDNGNKIGENIDSKDFATLPITTTDDYIMEQALEMEDYFMSSEQNLSNNKISSQNKMKYEKLATESLQAYAYDNNYSSSFTLSKYDSTSQVLPSVSSFTNH